MNIFNRETGGSVGMSNSDQEWGVFIEVSTVHGKTIENNSLTAYGSLPWTVNILGLSTVHQRLVNY